MTRNGKRVLIGISIAIVILLLIAAIFIGIIVWGLGHITFSGHSVIEYENLRAVMQDDVIYISDDFLNENNLQLRSIYSGKYGPRLGNVRLDYSDKKLVDSNTDFTGRVENMDSYTYELLVDNEYDDNDIPASIPLTVEVKGSVGKRDDLTFDKTANGGYEYTILNMQETEENLSKKCVVKFEEKISVFKKKYCSLEVSVSLSKNLSSLYGYSQEEIEKEFDKIISSAINNLTKYN